MKNPIGIFDSGIGGLSIWKEINTLMPCESTIYFADAKNAPYGEKSKHEIIAYCHSITNFLLDKNVKIIVVACNTATTNVISSLRKNFSVPFIGIEPATKPAAINTKTGKIGILATKGTLQSELFYTTSNNYRGKVEIIETIGSDLVRLIELGKTEDTKPLLIKYLSPMIERGVDNIVLGCTHYPFLIPIIKTLIPDSINIIDTGAAVALQTKYILKENGLLTNVANLGNHTFYTNGETEILRAFIGKVTDKSDQISLTKID